MSVPGGSEWIIILFIVLLFFGARKLPDLAGSFGKSIKEFRKASKDALQDDADQPDDAERTTSDSESTPSDTDPER